MINWKEDMCLVLRISSSKLKIYFLKLMCFIFHLLYLVHLYFIFLVSWVYVRFFLHSPSCWCSWIIPRMSCFVPMCNLFCWKYWYCYLAQSFSCEKIYGWIYTCRLLWWKWWMKPLGIFQTGALSAVTSFIRRCY